jgi:hypothetical protein
MVWFYERGGRFVRCEACPASDGQGFELAITGPDGIERIESFDTSDALLRRQEEVEATFTGDGWTGPHGRVI